MTTQTLKFSPEGEPDIVSSPMIELVSCFPWRPKLMGHLIPQNINMWLGNSADGSSSGLHHDHHDNLYILLKGRKEFRLFSPNEASNMYTFGKIVHIHANGRINYSSQPRTRGDGADINSSRAFRASLLVDEIAAAEAANGDEVIPMCLDYFIIIINIVFMV